MIVKNESAIILRCLKSVLPYIDTWVIHDTGSTDRTQSIIREFFEDVKIDGKLVEVSFRDFEFNRNLALTDAMAQEGVDYVLLIDADMLLVCSLSSEVLKSMLVKPAYQVFQKSSLVYANTRLVGKPCFPFVKYIGCTHEYLDLGPNECGVLDVNLVNMSDFGDGGSKADKFVRDRRLLENDVSKNPMNHRSWFYLAQTYKDMGEYTLAAETYKNYLGKNPSWDEERFFAQYMIGHCLFSVGNISEGMVESTKAFEQRPTRSEPLYHMVKQCRLNSWHRMGWCMAKMGTQIRFSTDRLFVEKSIYDYMFWYELHILACYVEPSRGLEICNYLLQQRTKLEFASHNLIQNIQKNMVFYLKPLHFVQNTERIRVQLPVGYNATNPSIVWVPSASSSTPGFLEINVRLVSYKMTDMMEYSIIRGGPVSLENPINTRHARLRYQPTTDEWQSTGEFEPTYEGPFFTNTCTGYEDLRMFRYQDETYASCTTRFLTHDELNHIALVRPDRSVQLITSPFPGRCEKNWMFFEHEASICFVYSYSPFQIYSLDYQKLSPTLVHSKSYNQNFQDFRGSAGPVMVTWQGLRYYLLVVHEVLSDYKFPRRYVHRFLLFLVDTFEVKYVSMPFTLPDDQGQTLHIQYVSGMAVVEETLYLTWGQMDAIAFVSSMEVQAALSFATKMGLVDQLREPQI